MLRQHYRCLVARTWRVWETNRPQSQRHKELVDCVNGCFQLRRISDASHKDIVFKSLYPEEQLLTLSLSEFLFKRFEQFGEKTALVDDTSGTNYRYSQLEELSKRIGSFFTRKGFKKGDIVCYYGTNNPEFALLLFGCASIGVVLTMANPTYTSGELLRQWQHSGAKSLVTIPALVPKAREAGILDIIVIGNFDGVVPFAKMLDDDGRAFPADVKINPKEDILILPYSSGTTGLPKGVMLTHHNLVANVIQFRNLFKTTIDDVNLAILPFYHIYGIGPVMLGTLQDGATLVTTPGFHPEGFLNAIKKHSVTQLHIVPPILLFLTRHPAVDKFDIPRFKNIISGAAPLSDSILCEFMEKRKNSVRQGYGLTETSPVVSLDNYPVVMGSVGQLVPNTEAKIVSLVTGESLNYNEVGELYVRGPQNMKGYLNNEKATKEMIDKDGWLHTGDVGYMKENNYLVITDRLKELIKYKGLQVAPAELEDLLHKHPAVQDVVVLGIPDDRAGELPRAYIILKSKVSACEQDIIEFVKQHVADHKQLRGGVEFIAEIPKSPSGKILRRILKEKYVH